jgi:acetyl-CoA carboxylase biotin carboxylase subunit
MGDKVEAKKLMSELGVPVVPGSDGAVETIEDAIEIADGIGYPVLIKAAAGGGGRGMKVARSREEMQEAFSLARTEAKASFRDESVYIEKFLERPRHIEVQVLGDGTGRIVHLGDRECSLQRRHQKILEEAGSPALNDAQRDQIGGIACKALEKIAYRSAGTLEFLYEDGGFYFIEMNTRLQVEHPVTEMITGIDLVREQIRIAAGAPLAFTQDEIAFSGHAIECRINAESPDTFIASPGRITDYHPPGGLGVRVDSALYSGYRVPPNYDSLVSKLIVHGTSRNECLMRLRRALEEYVIGGIETTIPLLERIVAAREFVNGDYDIHWLEKFVDNRG